MSRLAFCLVAWVGLCVAAVATRAADAPRQVAVQVSSTQIAAEPPRLFGFSGNIWMTPESFGNGVAERILQTPHAGLTRVSLGDQLLEHATSLDDLKRRLDGFALNDFLRRYKEQGGRVLFILDGTPRWLASDTSNERIKGPDQPAFRMSPSNNDAAWAEVVEAVVRHFNGRLKLDAYYEAWNEPNYYYRGTVEQFFRQYRASVFGARRADPKALIGGPGISEFVGVTTAGVQPHNDAEKAEIVRKVLDQRYLMRQFFDYAASTPLPELGLPRLPVDFVSFHAFYLDPTRFYAEAIPFIREALAADGYRRDTTIINTEWNIAAVPPYPEGDLNATQVGAAYAAVSLIAMNEAGVGAQSYQMYVDPGVPGYSGGMFTPQGLARASYNTFRLFSMLRGSQLRVTTSDPWVRACAFRDAKTLYVLVASIVPTPRMIKGTQDVLGHLRNADFTQALARAGLADAIAQGRALPREQADRAHDLDQAAERSVRADADKAARSGGLLTLEIDIAGLGAVPRAATRYVIDSHDANLAPQLANAGGQLQALARQAGEMPRKLQSSLHDAGVPDPAATRLLGNLGQGQALEQALGDVPAQNRDSARSVVKRVVGDTQHQIRQGLDAIENAPGAGLVEQPFPWPARGPLRIDAEADSVQLFVLKLDQ